MRRGVAGLTPSDYNRLFVLVVKEARDSPPSSAGDAVVSCLASQTADSRNWPTDDEFRAALIAPGLFDRMYRARLKALLVGLENHLRSDCKTISGGTLAPGDKKLNVEHVLPRKWEANWSLPAGATEHDVLRRQTDLHRLGNLTLATTKLNSSLSNKAWPAKRPALQGHSLVRLTTASILAPPDSVTDDWTDAAWVSEWKEDRIAVRGEWLDDHALRIWTRTLPADPANG